MEIKNLVFGDDLWLSVADYASNCIWQPTGAYLSKCMKDNVFLDWERVFAALENNSIIGFCALTKTSAVFGDAYTPYVGFVFVDETHRGNRISERLCMTAIEYAKSVGFEKVFLYSDLVDFYEKYGFIKIDEKEAPWGVMQSIYIRIT